MGLSHRRHSSRSPAKARPHAQAPRRQSFASSSGGGPSRCHARRRCAFTGPDQHTPCSLHELPRSFSDEQYGALCLILSGLRQALKQAALPNGSLDTSSQHLQRQPSGCSNSPLAPGSAPWGSSPSYCGGRGFSSDFHLMSRRLARTASDQTPLLAASPPPQVPCRLLVCLPDLSVQQCVRHATPPPEANAQRIELLPGNGQQKLFRIA